VYVCVCVCVCICVTLNVTHSYMWYASLICVPWRIYMCDMNHSYAWDNILEPIGCAVNVCERVCAVEVCECGCELNVCECVCAVNVCECMCAVNVCDCVCALNVCECVCAVKVCVQWMCALNKSCHTWYVMSNIWMCRGMNMNESYHIYSLSPSSDIFQSTKHEARSTKLRLVGLLCQVSMKRDLRGLVSSFASSFGKCHCKRAWLYGSFISRKGMSPVTRTYESCHTCEWVLTSTRRDVCVTDIWSVESIDCCMNESCKAIAHMRKSSIWNVTYETCDIRDMWHTRTKENRALHLHLPTSAHPPTFMHQSCQTYEWVMWHM